MLCAICGTPRRLINPKIAIITKEKTHQILANLILCNDCGNFIFDLVKPSNYLIPGGILRFIFKKYRYHVENRLLTSFPQKGEK